MSLLTPLLWSFLPGQLTSTLLPYLSTYLPRLFPPAPVGSPVYHQNYRIAYSGLIFAYLVYTFRAKEDTGWYALLGVSRGVDDEGLKRAFRTLSRRFHPDRSDGDSEVFIRIRQAYEVLTDPTKRYAYDRFGPDITHWKNCITVKDFIYSGLTHSVGFYVVSGGMTLVLSLLGKVTHGAYWRQTLFALLLYLELSLILSPTPPTGTVPFIPSLLAPVIPRSWSDIPQFLWVRTFHRIWTSLSIGITQLAGVWATDRLGDENEAMIRVSGLARSLEAEIVGQFQGEVVPILSRSSNPVVAERMLLGEMEQVLVDRTLSTHPAVRDSWQLAQDRHARIPASRFSPTHVVQAELELDTACRVPLPPSPPPSPRPTRRPLR